MFCWPCIKVYQYSETNVMKFYSVYWESRACTCFEHYLLILRRRCTSGTWYIACVLCQLAATRVGVELVSKTLNISARVKPSSVWRWLIRDETYNLIRIIIRECFVWRIFIDIMAWLTKKYDRHRFNPLIPQNGYLLTYLLTPCSRVLLEKLTGLQLVN
jgi:hypothetical protein